MGGLLKMMHERLVLCTVTAVKPTLCADRKTQNYPQWRLNCEDDRTSKNGRTDPFDQG